MGIIGGSGFYKIEGLERISELSVDTPWGSPSDKYSLFSYEEKEIIFLPRHGRGHKLLPSEINYRANIYGMKKLGVERIISVSAVGSYRQEIAPRDIVIVDQFFDRTRYTENNSFFGDGIVGHVSLAEPVCPVLSEVLYNSLIQQELKVHQGGTYVNMEGPAFSTKAESQFFKKMGMDVIGMTNMREARLAREAEICFSTIALVTDYDAWHEELEPVSVPEVMTNLKASIESARAGIMSSLSNIPEKRECACATALSSALMTDNNSISPESREKLSLLINKYLN
ncbi:MAG: S-methyl-5'-thioadenosine phosphorylase [Candidatus Marinimicrobia bacterium]|nr:S-methyl-5'-thioadenosine phosphorylase [Candidatus Neomarinimicrobiota bacterium]